MGFLPVLPCGLFPGFILATQEVAKRRPGVGSVASERQWRGWSRGRCLVAKRRSRVLPTFVLFAFSGLSRLPKKWLGGALVWAAPNANACGAAGTGRKACARPAVDVNGGSRGGMEQRHLRWR